MKKSIAIILAFIMIALFGLPVYAKSIADLKKKQEEINTQKQGIQQELNETKNEKSEVQQEMDKLDEEITKVTDDLEVINSELEKTKELLAKTEIELEDAQREREEQFEIFKKRARFMYMNGKVGYLDVIFKSKDFADLVNRIEYINRIVSYDKGIVERLKAAEALVAEKLEQTKKQKQEIQVLATQQKSKLDTLELAYAEKKTYIEQLDADEAKYLLAIQSLESSNKEIEALILQKQAAANRGSSSSGKSGGGVTVSATYTGGKLGWPVSGRLTSGYGGRSNPISGKGEFHTGIDIAAPSGTSIGAAGEGVVISAGWRNGYGNTVVVDHGGGVTTLYAHASKITVGVGQTVGRGETIAKVGSTGYSTGPHLHFEVRVNGSHTNPNNYLN